MTEQEVIDVEPVTEDPPEPSRELVHAPSLAVTPQVEAAELIARLAVIRDAMDNAMEKDVDYGVIPGTDKPTLYKPGAEKLGVLFQLDIQPENEKTWGPGDHLTVVSRAVVYHAPTGARLGSGEGICTTRESKYGKRKQERLCPHCKTPAVIKGKQEFGGGWLCWKKRDGCGAKFPDGDESIEGQEVGTIENPDLPDLWNTVDKMASKRARIDAVLAVTGASALFTQDVADSDEPTGDPDPVPPANTSRRTETGATEDQIAFVKAQLKGKTVADIRWYLNAIGVGGVTAETVEAKIEALGFDEASSLLDLLKTGPHPSPRQSDIPADDDGFDHEPQKPLDIIA